MKLQEIWATFLPAENPPTSSLASLSESFSLKSTHSDGRRPRKVFPQAFREAKKNFPPKNVLNLEGLTYLDSAGLGLLAISFEQARLDNIAMCLVNPVGVVREILDLAQLHRIMPVHEPEEQALRLTPSVLSSAT